MKKIFSILMAGVALFGASACCEIEDGTTDIKDWEIPAPTYDPKVYTITRPCSIPPPTSTM